MDSSMYVVVMMNQLFDACFYYYYVERLMLSNASNTYSLCYIICRFLKLQCIELQ